MYLLLIARAVYNAICRSNMYTCNHPLGRVAALRDHTPVWLPINKERRGQLGQKTPAPRASRPAQISSITTRTQIIP